MREPEATPVRVTIFGEEYVLRSEKDEEHTRACARYVDDSIQEAHLKSHVTEPHKAAILAAMEITDELLQLRDERVALEEDVTSRIRGLRQRVQEALDG